MIPFAVRMTLRFRKECVCLGLALVTMVGEGIFFVARKKSFGVVLAPFELRTVVCSFERIAICGLVHGAKVLFFVIGYLNPDGRVPKLS